MKIRGIEIKDMYAYIQGNIRYELFYSKFRWLIPKHIEEQIMYRINSMDIDCYNNGSCKMCGCKTTALQMANKACDKPCYPIMLNKHRWNVTKGIQFTLNKDTGIVWALDIKNLKFTKPWNGKEHI
jgi:hypothetical protein